MNILANFLLNRAILPVRLKFFVYFSIIIYFFFFFLQSHFHKTLISDYLLYTIFYLNNIFIFLYYYFIEVSLKLTFLVSLSHPKWQNPFLKLSASLSSQSSQPLVSNPSSLSLRFLSWCWLWRLVHIRQ